MLFMKKLEVNDRTPTHTLFCQCFVYFNGCHVCVLCHQFSKCFLIEHIILTRGPEGPEALT